jgi:hypothetical protein
MAQRTSSKLGMLMVGLVAIVASIGVGCAATAQAHVSNDHGGEDYGGGSGNVSFGGNGSSGSDANGSGH